MQNYKFEEYCLLRPWARPLSENWVNKGRIRKELLENDEDGLPIWAGEAERAFCCLSDSSWTDWENNKIYSDALQAADPSIWKVIETAETYHRLILPRQGVFELRMPKNAGAEFMRSRPHLPFDNAGDYFLMRLNDAGGGARKVSAAGAGENIYHVPFYDYRDLYLNLPWLEYPILYDFGFRQKGIDNQ